MTRARKNVGRITFVGAGPGDPGLLAVAATQALAAAQIVYADHEVPSAITELATGEVRPAQGEPAENGRPSAEVIEKGHHVGREVLHGAECGRRLRGSVPVQVG